MRGPSRVFPCLPLSQLPILTRHSRPTQSQLDLETDDIELEHKVRRFPSGSTDHGVPVTEKVDIESGNGGVWDGQQGPRRDHSVRRPPPPLPVPQYSSGNAI